MAVRTFLAIPLDAPPLDRLLEAQRKLAGAEAVVRWVERANLHLTVKFLGDVEDDRLAEVCEVAQAVAGEVEPFDLTVRGLVSVPPAGQMRMIWAEIAETSGRLELLAGLAEEAYAGMGFKMENRRFRPHLTVGRVKSGRNVPQLRAAVAEFAETDFGVSAGEELIVFSSKLTPDGPIYSALATSRLG